MEAFSKQLVGKEPLLRHSIHSPIFLNVHFTLCCGLVLEIILFYDFVRDVLDVDANVFGPFEWYHELKF